jgi:hypothetical protein
VSRLKNKKHYAQKLIPFIILAVVLYAIADWALIYLRGTGMSDTLTASWFAFWGTELVSLAVIKVKKVNKSNSEMEKEEI